MESVMFNIVREVKRMKNFNLIVLAVISFLVVACIYNVGAQSPAKSRTWELLLQERHCAIYEPRNVMVQSQNEFDALWEESLKGFDFGPLKPTVKPKVDFEKKWVIACFLGTVNTGGHSLEIQSIETGSASTLITIVYTRPGADCLTPQVIESPYFMATVDHFVPEKAEFKVITKDLPCE
jgi:hypothetical protein